MESTHSMQSNAQDYVQENLYPDQTITGIKLANNMVSVFVLSELVVKSPRLSNVYLTNNQRLIDIASYM